MSGYPEAASGVGTLLRAARLRCGQEIEQVSAMLRIRAANLEAIEEGRFDDLPGSTYAIGFVRAYADHLGLDAEEVVRRFRAEVASVNRQIELSFPAPIAEGSIPRGAILLIALILAGAVYGGWYYMSTQGLQVADLVPPVPEGLLSSRLDVAAPPAEETPRQSDPSVAAAAAAAAAAEGVAGTLIALAPEAEPAGSSTPQPAADPATPPLTPTETVVEAPSPPAAASEPEPAPQSPEFETVASLPAETVETEPAAIGPPAIPSAPAGSEERSASRVFGANEDARIVLRATSDSWVQVRGADNGLVMARLLRAGDSYRVPRKKGLILITGNAGALDILVDGKLVPPIGPLGAVRRGVALEPELLVRGEARRR